MPSPCANVNLASCTGRRDPVHRCAFPIGTPYAALCPGVSIPIHQRAHGHVWHIPTQQHARSCVMVGHTSSHMSVRGHVCCALYCRAQVGPAPRLLGDGEAKKKKAAMSWDTDHPQRAAGSGEQNPSWGFISPGERLTPSTAIGTKVSQTMRDLPPLFHQPPPGHEMPPQSHEILSCYKDTHSLMGVSIARLGQPGAEARGAVAGSPSTLLPPCWVCRRQPPWLAATTAGSQGSLPAQAARSIHY